MINFNLDAHPLFVLFFLGFLVIYYILDTRNWYYYSSIDLKLKTEYLQEKQGILIPEKTLQCQREMLLMMGQTVRPKI